ncbi:MAG: type II toxin-antitoxin system prevent-host-death family antitoxin [Gemmatimonadota bacterium]
MTEQRVPIARLKARLSEYLRRAKAGEVVVVTDRGTPVARLAPLEGEPALEGRLAQLARGGLVRGPRRSLDADFLEGSRPADPEGRSLEAVLEERAEGR